MPVRRRINRLREQSRRAGTLFSEEKTADGQAYHAFTRVVVRGNQVRVAP
jgi:hypothetical protein